MSTQGEFAVILKMNPLFADLGADELQRISGLCHTQLLVAGEVLFQKGDNGDALFGVRRGQIRRINCSIHLLLLIQRSLRCCAHIGQDHAPTLWQTPRLSVPRPYACEPHHQHGT